MCQPIDGRDPSFEALHDRVDAAARFDDVRRLVAPTAVPHRFVDRIAARPDLDFATAPFSDLGALAKRAAAPSVTGGRPPDDGLRGSDDHIRAVR